MALVAESTETTGSNTTGALPEIDPRALAIEADKANTTYKVSDLMGTIAIDPLGEPVPKGESATGLKADREKAKEENPVPIAETTLALDQINLDNKKFGKEASKSAAVAEEIAKDPTQDPVAIERERIIAMIRERLEELGATSGLSNSSVLKIDEIMGAEINGNFSTGRLTQDLQVLDKLTGKADEETMGMASTISDSPVISLLPEEAQAKLLSIEPGASLGEAPTSFDIFASNPNKGLPQTKECAAIKAKRNARFELPPLPH